MGLWSYFTGADKAESDALGAKRQALNQSQRTIYGEGWYRKTVQNDEQTAADDAAGRQAVLDEFKPVALIQNLKDSSVSAGSGIRDFLEPILAFPLRIIPPTGWLLIGVAVFIWLGGHIWLRGILAKGRR